METIYPEMWVPPIGPGARTGAVQNIGIGDACLDTLGDGAGQGMGAYPCHGQHGTQGFLLDAKGFLRIAMLDFKVCVGVVNTQCDAAVLQPFTYLEDGAFPKALRLPGKEPDGGNGGGGGGGEGGGGQCLEAIRKTGDRSPFVATWEACVAGKPTQQWVFS
jgi:hypothetical protein